MSNLVAKFSLYVKENPLFNCHRKLYLFKKHFENLPVSFTFALYPSTEHSIKLHKTEDAPTAKRPLPQAN